ncbi:glucosamine--fructose-6-phosphate aminotransferase [Dictyobacter alpinus]|uniref:Glutamine--fructose-6-phosphate aminotransferase [isomerizing] n=1 Tax=Dictyobacter alpinus TaxID=2014873 RepID=A0A402B1B6_9CHLR|nr:SIS domain-containing protein [Dictyobacter alpinus]GCE25141.1 glucosamine--fructose-6-phosphate aminotransferase [Dictyobacter alpinus]
MTFLDEIQQQPNALQTVTDAYFGSRQRQKEVAHILRSTSAQRFIFTGMGSSLFASHIAVHYLQLHGIAAWVIEANELRHFYQPLLDKETILVAVSQSGESEEVVQLCAEVQQRVAALIVLSNQPGSRLARFGNTQLWLEAGEEKMTASKTYTNTIAVLLFLASIILHDEQDVFANLHVQLTRSVEVMRQTITEFASLRERLVQELDPRPFLPVIGSGASYATTLQAECIIEETCKSFSAHYTTGQYIHGPIELIDERFAAIVLDFNTQTRDEVDRLMKSIGAFGGKVLWITNRRPDPQSKSIPLHISYPDDEITSPLIEIIPIELLVDALGRARNLQPGVLTRVVK